MKILHVSVIPITCVVNLRLADPKRPSKISSMYYLVTGLINKDPQEFLSVLLLPMHNVLYLKNNHTWVVITNLRSHLSKYKLAYNFSHKRCVGVGSTCGLIRVKKFSKTRDYFEINYFLALKYIILISNSLCIFTFVSVQNRTSYIRPVYPTLKAWSHTSFQFRLFALCYLHMKIYNKPLYLF
jgi:hypothetical protein